jgi:uncharacterized protein (UPF0261 family)
VFVDTLRWHLGGGAIKELPYHINDGAFADACVEELAEVLES